MLRGEAEVQAQAELSAEELRKELTRLAERVKRVGWGPIVGQ